VIPAHWDRSGGSDYSYVFEELVYQILLSPLYLEKSEEQVSKFGEYFSTMFAFYTSKTEGGEKLSQPEEPENLIPEIPLERQKIIHDEVYDVWLALGNKEKPFKDIVTKIKENHSPSYFNLLLSRYVEPMHQVFGETVLDYISSSFADNDDRNVKYDQIQESNYVSFRELRGLLHPFDTEVWQQILDATHPDIATFYKNSPISTSPVELSDSDEPQTSKLLEKEKINKKSNSGKEKQNSKDKIKIQNENNSASAVPKESGKKLEEKSKGKSEAISEAISEELLDKPEEKSEEKQKEKLKEKLKEKSKEKSKEKLKEKPKEKSKEKLKEKPKEKSKEKLNEKSKEISKKKLNEKSEEKLGKSENLGKTSRNNSGKQLEENTTPKHENSDKSEQEGKNSNKTEKWRKKNKKIL